MATLEEAMMGHFQWEEMRKPDPVQSGQSGQQSPAKNDSFWVAVGLEFNDSPEKPMNWGTVEPLIDQLRAARFNKIVVIGEYEKQHIKAELTTTSPPSVRLMLLAQRSKLSEIVRYIERVLGVSVLSIGGPFLRDAFTPPAHIPSPIEFMSESQKPKEDLAAVATAPEPPAAAGKEPIIGIIDDGIAYLNKQFCTVENGKFASRFRSVWLQSDLFADMNFRGTDVPFGDVLETAELNSLLNDGQSEACIYSMRNSVLYPPPSQQATNTHLAHGTHVLDLAAGAEPAIDGPPLIAVQLAPGMVWDTSGRRLEPFLVMGLRWMVQRALREDRDLVVNISLGSLAGPGDENNFVASAIKYEIDAFERISKENGQNRRMRVVVAYGNSWRSDLVAEFTLTKDAQTQSLDWRILPDGYSSSYMELRVPKTANNITLALTPPAALTGGLSWTFNTAAPTTINTPSGVPVAQILPLPPERDALAVLIAIAPTACLEPGGQSLTPAGAWKVTVATSDTVTESVTMRVQRNDTPVGYRSYGRQSYLADSGLSDWDEEMRDYTQPAKGSAIKRTGTANAYAGLADIASSYQNKVYFVGAARRDPGALKHSPDGDFLPSLYTSEGHRVYAEAFRVKSPGPSLAALGDDGRFLGGRSASSVLSGARTLRLSGTSVAAGLITRRVAEALPGTSSMQDEFAMVLGRQPTGSRDTRLGFGVAPT